VEENEEDTLKKIVLGTIVAFVAALICTGGAAATDTRTLSEFLMACGRNARICQGNLEDYLRAARDQGFVCLPEDLSLERAVREELAWLRKQNTADEALAKGFAEDAQWTAVNALWPCKKDDAPPTQ
jgi:hypothetical protein